ncbi:MAG: ABC transporter ATP-binding protein [Candidatus Saccharimonadales bacterium]
MLATYGKRPVIWMGLVAEIVRTILFRVVTVFVLAAITAAMVAGNSEHAQFLILVYVVLFLAGMGAGLVSDLSAVKVENDEYHYRVMHFYERITHKDMAFYRDHQTGYLAALFRQHLDNVLLFVRFLRIDVVRVLVSLVAPAAVLLVVQWQVGLVALLIVVGQVVYISWSSHKATKYRIRANEIYRKLTGEVSDEITNIVAFKAAGMAGGASKRVYDLSLEEAQLYWLRRKMVALLDLPRGVFTLFGTAAALWVIIATTTEGPAAVGLSVLTVMYLFQINRNVGEVPTMVVQHDEFITKIAPTLAYVQENHQTVADAPNPKPMTVTKGAVDFKAVSFRYDSKNASSKTHNVFTDFSLRIKAGEQVGVVGLSGAGKSTLAGLLMRFDDVVEGSITIDGVDIRDVKQDELRRNIAYVPQEPLLLHRTVRENIAFADIMASDDEIIAAATAAHAQGFIDKLPDGYSTIVGERGVKLSGGQKQRIVIARAILKKAPITIFDEATSALDSASEHIIQKALPDIIGRRTAIIVAHRLSTVAGLDRIIVMEDGAIIEQGTHEALLRKKGRYYSLWQKQSRQSEE